MVDHLDKESVRVTHGKIVSLAMWKIIIGRVSSYLSLAQFFMIYFLLAIPYIKGAVWKIAGAVVIGIFIIVFGWWDFHKLYGVENEISTIQSPIAVKYYKVLDRIEANQEKIIKRLEKLEKR